MSIWRYANSYHTSPAERYRVTLGEGQTPLIRSRRIGPSIGLSNLYFKLESVNPTGSYKDRFAASALSHLASDGAKVCIGCSSGNTGAALAAYSAALGLPCVLAIVDGAPAAKLEQMLIYGATLVRLKDFGTDAAATDEIVDNLQRLAAAHGTVVQVSVYRYSPKGMSGVESLGLELADSGISIDHVFCPAGGGGLTLAVARGLEHASLSTAVHCVQPQGNDTISTRLREGFDTAEPCTCTTLISGLQVANVMDGTETLQACRESGGTGFVVSDSFVLDIQARLAREEGIFAEPAGAVALAGVVRAVNDGEIARDATVVCLVTGSGFKDESSKRRMLESVPPCTRGDTFDVFERAVDQALERHE